MTLVEILLFLILTILVASYFNYFGVEQKNKSASPEVMLFRWLLWIVISAVFVWIFSKGINYLI